jgi:hypothetical protein
MKDKDDGMIFLAFLIFAFLVVALVSAPGLADEPRARRKTFGRKMPDYWIPRLEWRWQRFVERLWKE